MDWFIFFLKAPWVSFIFIWIVGNVFFAKFNRLDSFSNFSWKKKNPRCLRIIQWRWPFASDHWLIRKKIEDAKVLCTSRQHSHKLWSIVMASPHSLMIVILNSFLIARYYFPSKLFCNIEVVCVSPFSP